MVQIKHDYDYNGNRLNRLDTLNTTGSELYAYDGINQLNSFKRGTLSAARTEIASPSFAETWNHDKTGNWTSFVSGGTTQNRTHSKANEIATLGGSATNVGADKNGNMTKITKPASAASNYALTYDAWNRVATVKDGQTTVATYHYNGLNHRVKKTVDSVVTKSTFSENWQELESVTGSETLVYVWGLRYVDDLVYRQRDTEKIYSMADSNWNVIALSDASGTILERFRYDAFGRAAICDGGFVTKSESAYAWSRAFTGQVLDSETGLMLYRNRFYHPTLGRGSVFGLLADYARGWWTVSFCVPKVCHLFAL